MDTDYLKPKSIFHFFPAFSQYWAIVRVFPTAGMGGVPPPAENLLISPLPPTPSPPQKKSILPR